MQLKCFVWVNIHRSSDQTLYTVLANALLSGQFYIPVDGALHTPSIQMYTGIGCLIFMVHCITFHYKYLL